MEVKFAGTTAATGPVAISTALQVSQTIVAVPALELLAVQGSIGMQTFAM
jgi:hypothetical protein